MTHGCGTGFTEVIDVAPLFDGAGGPSDETDRAIARSLERHGNFVAAGAWPGIDREAARLFEFFTLDDDAKTSCATCRSRSGNPNIYRGFYPAQDGESWSRREIFDIGPEPPMTSPELPGAESFREPNAWPDREPCEGWRDALTAMLEGQRETALALLASLFRGLGLDEAALLAPARGRNATLRLLHYASDAESPDHDEPVVITGCHVDTGILSMIWQDSAGGLQMQGPDGTWRDTPIVADGLSVHCADLLETPSAGRLKATPHRVLGAGDTRRRSMGFFLEPDFETLVAPPSGDEVTYARHLVNEFPDRFRRPPAAA